MRSPTCWTGLAVGWSVAASVALVMMALGKKWTRLPPTRSGRAAARAGGQAPALMPVTAGVICVRRSSLSGAEPADFAAACWPSALVV